LASTITGGGFEVMQMPPVPALQGLHPLVVHFPIALLMVAPVFILVGVALAPERGRPFLTSALILMALGTAGIFLAGETGAAASKVLHTTPEIKVVLDQHEDLAETVEFVFVVLTALYAIILFAPRILTLAPSWAVNTVLPLAFLAIYIAGAVLLADAAHQGGRLVYELDARVPMVPVSQAVVAGSGGR
jgi:uncharacterized membrane protein